MPQHPHYTTPPADRISFGQKSAYAVGSLMNNLQAAALPALVVILNLGLGMDPVLVGFIGFIPRLFDAISDPIMGYISDNAKTRWGRRRPFMLVGAAIAGLIFAAMWQLPPGYSESFYFWVFLISTILYFLAYTIYSTPFVAFGFEMTPDYHERTRLQAFANTAGQLAWLSVPWFYALMSSNLFEDTVHGARVLALWVGGAIILLGIIPAIFCREKLTTSPLPEHKEQQSKSLGFKSVTTHTKDFLGGIVTTFKCSPFVRLCSATFLVFNGFQLGMSFSLYVMIYYVFKGSDSDAGILNGQFGTLTALCTIGVIPFTAWISTKLGKRRTFLLTISLSIAGYALKWFGYNPDNPQLLLISCPLVAFGTGSLFTLMGSMVADVCDYDEIESNQRREGVFAAIYWWMVKVGIALAGLLTGVMLSLSGFDVALKSAQTEQTLFLLRVFDVGIPILTSGIALWIMYGYEITESKAHEIRATLDKRRSLTK